MSASMHRKMREFSRRIYEQSKHLYQYQALHLSWAHGVVASHPLSMQEALGSIPSVSMLPSMFFFATTSNVVEVMHDLSGCGLGTRHVTRI